MQLLKISGNVTKSYSSFSQKGVAINHKTVPISINTFNLDASIVPKNKSILASNIKTPIANALINFSIFII